VKTGRPYEPGELIVVSEGALVRVRETGEMLPGPMTGVTVAVNSFDDPTTSHPFTVVWVMWSQPLRIEQHSIRGLPSPVR
jgi:hypothetical protein